MEPVFTKEDLYKFNQLITKLEKSGRHNLTLKMREVRDFCFDEDGECTLKG